MEFLKKEELISARRKIIALLGESPRSYQEALDRIEHLALAEREKRPFAWLEDRHGIPPLVAAAAIGGKWLDGTPIR